MNKIVNIAERLFNKYNAEGKFSFVSDERTIKILFHLYFDRPLNLTNPITFNEKIQWLKLNNRNPAYSTMVDKAKVKMYVSERIGKGYLIRTLGLWDSFDDIDFYSLPKQFVLKCTHDSGDTIICHDKEKFDYKTAKRKISKGLKTDFYLVGREWPYKNVKPRIIAEEYIATSENDLPDYKFHCFNGKVKLILVCRNRFGTTGMTEDFFDENWSHLDIKRPGHENGTEALERPEKLEEMIALAEKLSQNIPFLRVDFYYVNNRIYFGELTFFPASGFTKFVPEQWDTILGSYLQLPGRFITDN